MEVWKPCLDYVYLYRSVIPSITQKNLLPGYQPTYLHTYIHADIQTDIVKVMSNTAASATSLCSPRQCGEGRASPPVPRFPSHISIRWHQGQLSAPVTLSPRGHLLSLTFSHLLNKSYARDVYPPALLWRIPPTLKEPTSLYSQGNWVVGCVRGQVVCNHEQYWHSLRLEEPVLSNSHPVFFFYFWFI